MSTLWTEQPGGSWSALPLPAERESPLLLETGVAVLHQRHGMESTTALLVRAGQPVRVNGLPVPGGFRVLHHRDEILLGRSRYCYSAESTPVCQPFQLSSAGRRPSCPVCRGPLQDGDVAVQCPGCGRWHHQIAATETRRARTCWTYTPECRFCRHPTSLSGEPVWTPAQEESDG